MENTLINQDNKIRTWENDPQYFGAYLNMARLNIFNISNHLSAKFGTSSLKDEEKISDSFLCNKDDKKFKNKQNQIYSNLTRYMPITKVFDFERLPKPEKDKFEELKNESKDTSKYFIGKDFKALSDTLKIVFNELNDFRNDYSHYFSTEKGNKRKLEVSKELKDFLNINIERARQYTKERFKDVYSEVDFNISQSLKVVNDDNTITQEGIVFLTAMFLDRESAFLFINKIKGLKGTQYKSFKANREVLMAFCLRLPHDKFVSENIEQSFSLELINELNKCPKPLYNVITEESRNNFKPVLDEEQLLNVIENSIPDTIDHYEEYIESITKKMRNENRFSYFALKYIDQKELFNKWRFQINLGKVILADYTKSLNGVGEQRIVVENAKAFGRLQDLIDEENVLNKIIKGKQKTEFEQFAPHYNFDTKKNNKIGISRKTGNALLINENKDRKIKNNLLQPHPEAFLSINELPKIILLEYLDKGKTEQIINDFIDLNNSKIFNKEFMESIVEKLAELDVFYKRSQGRKQINAYLTTDKNIDYEKINNLNNRKQKLNQVLAEHNLNDKQIPSRILEYWLNIIDVQTKTSISDNIKLMKRDCMSRLKDIKNHKAPRLGEMATFLAKDIVAMIISKEKKQKITSFYYEKMQQCLALFADKDKKELFIQICNNELKLNDIDGHPFLKNINLKDVRYISDLYKIYLEEKGLKIIKEFNNKKGKYVQKDKSWLRDNFYKSEWNENAKKNLTVVALPENKSKIPYSLLQLEKGKSGFDEWFDNITKGKVQTDKNKPIDLPTNLFDDTLIGLLKDELLNKNINFKADANYNELFKTWWDKIRDDSTQNFYNSEREYIFEEIPLNFQINSKAKFNDYYADMVKKVFYKKQNLRTEERKKDRSLPDINPKQVVKTIRNKVGSTEKEIRIVQEEDRLMLLMFETMTDSGLKPKLKDIDKLLNESIPVRQTIKGELSFDASGDIIMDKKLITKNIIETRKRKEFSVLKKYIYDRRLPELFEYFTEDDIQLEKIKLELDCYNKVKDIVFDLIFKLEEVIINKNKKQIIELNQDKDGNKQSGNIPHRPYLNWLLKKELITEKEYTFMNMVRNTFSHNQFPQKKTIELFVKTWNNERFAEQILGVYKQKLDCLIELLNKDTAILS